MFFIINVDLTEEGLLHVEDIILHMFQYIQKLRAEGPQEWVFQECKDLNAVAFRFKDKERPRGYTSKIAGKLHYYPLNGVLTAEYLLEEFRPDLIDMVLDKLRPENVRVAIVSKSFEGKTDHTEQWYGTQYKQEAIPEDVIQKWQNADLNGKFKLPTKNEFIPTNFEILSLEKDATPYPALIKDTAMSKLWFKQDDKFFLPKACLNFEFFSPFAYVDPLHCNMAYLYLELLKDSLNEYAYAAELAGLSYDLQNTIYGMYLSVKGYNDKQPILLKKITEKMATFEIDKKRFEIIKEAYMRSLNNFRAEQPHQHAMYYLRLLMTEVAWTKDELKEALDDVTLPRLKAFIPQLLSRLHPALPSTLRSILGARPPPAKRLCGFPKRTYSTMNNLAIQRIEDQIVKSPEDKREYRGLELANGIKVLLISDPTTDKSSAALDVHIGSLSDPPNIPGLSHFCEHMLFLGTKKYPKENEYSQFLSEHAGSSNAFTSGEHTNYYFDVSYEHLEGALDRFAQFFLCPLFDASCKDREVNAVDSEHEKNVMNDAWRLFQLEKATGNPKHPFSKFGTGNKYTLETRPNQEGTDVREELLKFHSTYYSSNLMAICVLGRESLDDLTNLVMKLFSEVENKNVPLPEFPEHPFQEEHLKQLYKIVPIKDIRNLYVTFPIPDLQQYYKSNPGHYLGHLIGHEGPGSLLSELKSKGWVNNLVGGQKEGAPAVPGFLCTVHHRRGPRSQGTRLRLSPSIDCAFPPPGAESLSAP